jgi:hypothetical protein
MVKNEFDFNLLKSIAALPNLHLQSWKDERLPEMLWAALIVIHFDKLSAMHAISPYLRYNRVDNYRLRKDQKILNGFFEENPSTRHNDHIFWTHT